VDNRKNKKPLWERHQGGWHSESVRARPKQRANMLYAPSPAYAANLWHETMSILETALLRNGCCEQAAA